MTSEEIDGAVDKFSKWNQVFEKKLQKLGRKFIGGNKPTVGDFTIFAIYADMVLNQNTKVTDLRNSLRAELVSTPTVQDWTKQMQGELKDFLA